MMYKKMPEYYGAYDIVKEFNGFYMEMSREEASVLSGLIRKHEPKKIVEIGCAAGGSTCLIMKTLELLNLEAEVISIDLNEKFYRNTTKDTGYLLKDNKSDIKNYNKHKFLLGKLAVDIDLKTEVGNNIDILFLDTVHLIPGEILDFLLFYPYLSSDGIVVLHDTNMHNRFNRDECICNRVLVNTVTADKYFNPQWEFLNIGAFQINEDTKNNINDVFASLILPWMYYDEEQIKKYIAAYKKLYLKESVEILEIAEEANKRSKLDSVLRKVNNEINSGKKILIYGYGGYGKKLIKFLKKNSIEIEGIVISDGIEKDKVYTDYHIYSYSDIPYKTDEIVIVVATTYKEVYENLKRSKYKYIDLGNVYHFL